MSTHDPHASSDSSSTRLEELLSDRATEGLSAEEWRELGGLLAANPDAAVEEFDLAAAGLEVELQNAEQESEAFEPLPDHLRDRIVAEGRVRVRAQHAPLPRREEAPGDPREPALLEPCRASSPASLGWLGYAAAALFGIALGFLLTSDHSRDLTAEESYAKLLERRAPAELVRATWIAVDGNGAEKVRGEVVWCDLDQEGYMLLEGLTPNEISKEQYQLWIVDGDRGHKEPVDGGVFDIAVKDGVQTIPIDSALIVDQPGLFVITLEPKGGVVVSDCPFLATAEVGS